MNINTFGTLYVVATPIGNLMDMSLRAIEILKSVDCIAVEDTRRSLQLLQHFGISKPLHALHEHNERQDVDKFLSKLSQGASIALISDAGTPLISDPGYHLIKHARQKGIKIVPIPGPCAAITALSVSGLPTDRFVFEGFLPVKQQGRLQRLTGLLTETRTIILYEAPHRILDLLNAIKEVMGDDREIVLGRELTKMFETIISGPVNKVLDTLEEDTNQQRGEMVVIISGGVNIEEERSLISTDEILKSLLEELSVKKAAALAAKITGKRKNVLYERALEIAKKRDI